MAMQATEKIWHNGKFIRWEDAKIHVLSHVVSYGSAVFEGIRCYETINGPAIFRVREHMQRMINSGKIYRIEWPFSAEELSSAAAELVRKQDVCLLYPSDCSARIWRHRRGRVEGAYGSLHGLLGMGTLPWPGSD